MEKSQSITNLAKALIVFHVKVDTIKKDARNPFFKSNYASLSNILDAIDTPLNEAGLTFSQFPANGNGLTSILIHAESGEYMMDTYQIHPVPDYQKEKDRDGNIIWRGESYISPQAVGSAITYARRYALSAILGLNIDEDDDGNAASKNIIQTDKKAVQNNSTSFNHKEIAKPGLPLISNEQFKKMMDLIRGGDAGIFERTKKKYSFESTQLNIATQATNKIINQPQTN